jgi:putative adhesin
MIRKALLGVVLMSGVAAGAQSQVKVERGLRLDADGSVRISNLVGSVRVTGWNRDSVALHGVLPKGDKVFMGGGRQGMKMFVEPLNDRNPQPTRLDVMVPARAKIWVKTATAEIEVSGVTGELDLYVVGGKIRVSGTPSELNAEAIDGDIEVNGKPGWLRAKSASGTVTFNGSSDDASISTVSGGITVNSVPAEGNGKFERAKLETVTGPIRFNADIQKGAAIDFSTHSGTLDIAIPRRTGADFEIASIAGTITNDLNFARPVKGRYGRGSELVMTNSSGGARVTIRSFKGPVTLRIAK